LAHRLLLAANPIEILDSQPSLPVAREYGATLGWKYWVLPILGVIALTVGIVLTITNHLLHGITVGKRGTVTSSAPWATLFDSSRRVLIVALSRTAYRRPLSGSGRRRRGVIRSSGAALTWVFNPGTL